MALFVGRAMVYPGVYTNQLWTMRYGNSDGPGHPALQWDGRLRSRDTLEFEILSRNYIVQFEPVKVPAGPRHQIAPPHGI